MILLKTIQFNYHNRSKLDLKKFFQQFGPINMEADKFIDIDEEADNNCYLTDKEIIDIVTEREHEDIEEMSFSVRVSSK